MWAYIKDGSIEQTNNSQTRLMIRGTYFPAKYANEWTVQQKKDYGVYEVVQDNTNLKDAEYYTNGSSTFTFASDTVTLTYASATAKNLAETIHQDIAKGFLFAIDAKTKQRIGADHQLKNGDVIKIVSSLSRG